MSVRSWTESSVALLQPNHERQPIVEMLAAEESGEFTYIPVQNEVEVTSEEGPQSPPPSPQTEVNVRRDNASDCFLFIFVYVCELHRHKSVVLSAELER